MASSIPDFACKWRNWCEEPRLEVLGGLGLPPVVDLAASQLEGIPKAMDGRKL